MQDLKWVESLVLADWRILRRRRRRTWGSTAGFSRTSSQPTSDQLKIARLGSPRCISSLTPRQPPPSGVHKVQYGGEVVVSDRWRAEFGEEIKNADQHFRIVYLTAKPEVDDAKITAALKDARTVVCRPESSFGGDARGTGRLDCGGADEAELIGSKPDRPARIR